MNKFDRFWLAEIDTAVRMAYEKRRDMLIALSAGKGITAAQIAEMNAHDRVFDLLKDHWPEMKARLDGTLSKK